MPFSVKEIADAIGGTIIGDNTLSVNDVASIEDATSSDIVVAGMKKAEAVLKNCNACVAVVSKDVAIAPMTLIQVDNDPEIVFNTVSDMLRPSPKIKVGIDERAVISPTASIADNVTIMAGAFIDGGASVGEGCVIYPNVYIGANVKVGSNCVFYPNVSIYYDCVIGDRVILHSCSVIGADGYGYKPVMNSNAPDVVKLNQVGNVIIEADVEVGANTCIDRARFGHTRIGSKTKIDNLVQIAHNCKVGSMCGIVAQSALAGRSSLGNGVIVYGQSALSGGVHVNDGAVVNARSGVNSDVKAGDTVWGAPAKDAKDAMREIMSVRKLPKLLKTVRRLEARINELEQES